MEANYLIEKSHFALFGITKKIAVYLGFATALAGASLALPSFQLQAQAYPVLIPAKTVPWIVGTKRENLIAITKKGESWLRIPTQIEEIEDDVAIVFRNPTKSLKVRKGLHKPKTKDPFEGYFDNYHRIALNDNHFGTCDKACTTEVKAAAKKQCKGNSYRSYSRMVKVELDLTKRVAFLVDCMSKQPEVAESTSSIDFKNHILRGLNYEFHYKNDESVMLDTFKVGPKKTTVLKDTEMHVYLKPKFMFDMHFENDDVTAEVSSITKGPLSLAVEIATALNVFVFQINKQICCDINVFEDSLYFPVLLDLPYAGNQFLKGSGLFYGFGLTKETEFEYYPAPKETKERPVRGATAMILKNENKVITVGFGNLKSAKGTPLAPVEKTKEELAKGGFPKVKSKRGIFYDATLLPDGFNHFNVWFYVGTREEKEKLVEYAQYGVTYKAKRVW